MPSSKHSSKPPSKFLLLLYHLNLLSGLYTNPNLPIPNPFLWIKTNPSNLLINNHLPILSNLEPPRIQLLRRNTLLDPRPQLLQRTPGKRRSIHRNAVIHPRNLKIPPKLLNLNSALRLDPLGLLIQSPSDLDRDSLVRHTVPHENLPPALPESSHIRDGRPDDGIVLLNSPPEDVPESLPRHRRRIKCRILLDEQPDPFIRHGERHTYTPCSIRLVLTDTIHHGKQPSKLRPRNMARKHLPPLLIQHTPHNLLNNLNRPPRNPPLNLLPILPITTKLPPLRRPHIKPTLPQASDNPIPPPITQITRFNPSLHNRPQLTPRRPIPPPPHNQLRKIQRRHHGRELHGRTHTQHPVKVPRIPLRNSQPLPPARRTPLEVAIPLLSIIIRPQNGLPHDSELVQTPVSKVDQQRPINVPRAS
ncbi:hypothetical protein CPAR01_07044 [Colletotrichum paranaense]|uniref:Uncharacterized protein n=1 Tax=Colletotrichum paranaense TaxID=1914294 RepID=A0ABQ9SNV0_9PEZI|nr:uncharacterized protein CPAR01_07044 [Colletotrichum paranaense]KAK1541055.1 hypothetical protein CPAR01_07044 [Colletotrichum paranaense]